MYPSQKSVPLTGVEPTGRNASPTKAIPSTNDTAGPAMPIRNSAPGLLNISLNWETPPKSQSVIPSICIPLRRATIECPISCSRIETKKTIAATTAMIT